MPLIETTGSLIPFFLRDVGRKMEINVINTFYFESGRKVKVVRWKFSASENVDLRLSVDRWAVRKTIDGDPIPLEQYRVSAVGEAASCFIRIEAVYAQELQYDSRVATLDTYHAVSRYCC